MTTAATLDSPRARQAMIDSQLRVSGINQERVLAAMAAVAREDHVPAAARDHAYIDRAIPLAPGHALPAPLVQASMLAQAQPGPADKVLIVSCGSGYLAALVEEMGALVETVSASDAVAGTGMGDDYTLLLIDGAIEHLPDQLADRVVTGGRIVTGITAGPVTRLALCQRTSAPVDLKPVADLGMPGLPEFAAAKNWSF